MTGRPAERQFRSGLVIAALAAALAPACLRAEPTPAVKKSAHRSQPPHPSQSAPDRTGAIPKAPPSTQPPQAPAGLNDAQSEAVPEAFYLPEVPRARMRDCGEAWRARKLAGDIGDKNWREFAMTCLVSEATAGHKPAQ